MSNQPTPLSETTTTINLSALRSAIAPLAASLDVLSEEERQVISNLPEGSAMLIGISGPGKGSRYLLNIGQTTIGRDPSSEIFLDDVTVSRKHARVEHEIGTNYAISDLGSLNGTYLNGVGVSESVLVEGDELQIGKYKLTFFVKGK